MKISKHVTGLSCAAILAMAPPLTLACSKKPVVSEPEPAKVKRSAYHGLWEARDKSGDIYTVRFTNDGWECRLEQGGASMPHYRGTYTHTGASLNLLIVEEGDLKTMGWRPQRGNFSPNITGVLSSAGRVMNIRALTETDFLKKR